MMKILPIEDVAQAKRLWKAVHGDSDAFIDEYFHINMSASEHFCVMDGQTMAALLFLCPSLFKVAGRLFESRLISGCATLPAYRGRGLMKQLIERSFDALREKDICFCTLFAAPVSPAFYERFGFETIAFAKREQPLESSGSVTIYESFDALPADELKMSYAKFMTQFQNGYERTEQRGEELYRLHLLSGGKIAVLNEDTLFPAYCLFERKNGRSLSIETVYFNEEQKNALLCAAQVDEYKLPSMSGEQSCMLRILDVFSMLQAYPLAEGETFSVCVTDGFLNETQTFFVRGCMGANIVQSAKEAEITLSVAQLSALLCGAKSTDAATKEGRLFPQRKSCCFDQF